MPTVGTVHKATLFVLCLVPFVRLLVLGGLDRLGANPVEFVTRSTGTWTLVLVCATLAVSPLRRLTGISALLRLRRMLGLFACAYGCLHTGRQAERGRGRKARVARGGQLASARHAQGLRAT